MLKKICVLFFAFFLGVSVFSCTTTTAEKPQLNLMISGLQQPSEKVFLKTFVRLFEAETGISVNLSYVLPADLKNQIASEQTGNAPTSDAIMVDTANMKPYVENGWMSDLASLVNSFTDRTITDKFTAWTNAGESQYFLPVSFDVYISIFSVDALPYMPSTVDVLRNEDSEIIQIESITWEEYAAWAVAIKQATGFAKAGLPMSATNSQLIYAMGGIALAYGSQPFPRINETEAISAWNLIAGMANQGALVSETVLSTVNQIGPLLTAGTLWLGFGHMGPIGSAYAANPSQYVLGPAPIAESTETAGSTAGAWTFGIPKNAPHYEEAQTWLAFLTEPETNYLYCSQLGGVISPVEEVISHLGTSNTDRIMAVGLNSFQGQVNLAIVDTSHYTSWTEVKEIYIALCERLLSGVPIMDAEADAFQAQLDALHT